jgi:hypothetical protein
MGSLPVREPVVREGKVEEFTLKIKGKPFFCHCKCNVFHQPDNTNSELYKCNCCGSEFETE